MMNNLSGTEKLRCFVLLVFFIGMVFTACSQHVANVEPESIPKLTKEITRISTSAPTTTPTRSATKTPTQTPTVFVPELELNNIDVKSHAEKIAQLVGDYDNQRKEPTQNRTAEQYQLSRTDLGIPFQHRNRIYILFGDAWNPPDDPIAYTTDMNPDDGLELVFLENESGRYRPIQIPGVSLGAFEVPTEGISIDNRMIIYATTDHSDRVVMGRSVVAVSDDDGYTFSYLYDFSTEHFINISIVKTDESISDGFPEPDQSGLAIFGSGLYRESDVRLAFQTAAQIENPDEIQYFAGLNEQNQPRWSQFEEDARALFHQPCVGEFSVSYNPFIQKWIMLYNCALENSRGINLRTANNAWGPWSDPVIIFHPWDDDGYCNFIHVHWEYENCDDVHDEGRENEWGGEYGPYQFEELAVGNRSSTTIYFTMSTWNPYTVVLMKATLEKQ